MNIRKPYQAVALAVVTAVLLGGCATTHLATSTARDGIGADDTPGPTGSIPSTPSSSTPTASTPTSTGPKYDVTPADFAAIKRLMAARANAVIGSDEGAFMATVDKGRPEFAAAQEVVYENLQDLPISSLRYDVADYGLGNADGITGGPLVSPPIVEHIFFKGTDKRPMSTGVSSTFVKRSGHWLLAADTTDDPDGGGLTARPWDGPRIDVVVRGDLIVVADASASGRAASVADRVEDDLAFDAGILDIPTNDHLMVDATTSGSVAAFGNDESAAAITFAVGSGSHFKTTAFAGMRIKLDPKSIQQLLDDPVTLRHELTHFLMVRANVGNPTWLTEGLAEYVSVQPDGFAAEVFRVMSLDDYDRLMDSRQALIPSGVFGTDPHTEYPLAMACVTYLVDHGGIGKLKDLMAGYAAHPSINPDERTAPLLRQIYEMTPADVAHGAFDLLDAVR